MPVPSQSFEGLKKKGECLLKCLFFSIGMQVFLFVAVGFVVVLGVAS